MKYKIIKIGNPNYMDDLTGFDNDKYPNIVRYVGEDDFRYFLVNVDDENDFYHHTEFLCMINLNEYNFLELS